MLLLVPAAVTVIVLCEASRPAAMLPCCAQVTVGAGAALFSGKAKVTTAHRPAAATATPLPIQDRMARLFGFSIRAQRPCRRVCCCGDFAIACPLSRKRRATQIHKATD